MPAANSENLGRDNLANSVETGVWNKKAFRFLIFLNASATRRSHHGGLNMSESTGTIISMSQYLRRKAGQMMRGVGLCAVFSRQGDWAFDYAFALARRHKARLNIFHFLESPYTLRRDVVYIDPEKTRTVAVTPELVMGKDREIRELFEERLGDYDKVGFRLCEGFDEWELRKCFKKGEYEVLVIGYAQKGASFGGKDSIESFGAKFKAPVILVGPDSPDSFYLNELAMQRLSELMIPAGKWKRIGA
jgi:hypothetical protein